MYDKYEEELWREFIKKHSLEIFSKIHKAFNAFNEIKAQNQQNSAPQSKMDNFYNPNNNTFELSAVVGEPRYAEITNKPYSGPEIYSKPPGEIYQNSNVNPKYAGLTPMQKAQKAASKSPVSTTEGHYYGLASRLNDGDKLSKYDKDQNNIYSVKDFNGQEHGQSYAQKAAKMQGLNINNPADYEKIQNTKVVMPKEGSTLYNHAKNSDTTKQWVAQNYEKYKNGTIKPEDQHIQYGFEPLNKAAGALYNTIHNAEMNKSKLNSDGSFIVWPEDGYDFEKWKYQNLRQSQNFNDFKSKIKHNIISYINNNAHEQQQKGQLENYILSMPITYSKDEVDNILSSQSNNANNSQQTLNNVTFKLLLEELKKYFRR